MKHSSIVFTAFVCITASTAYADLPTANVGTPRRDERAYTGKRAAATCRIESR